MVDGGFSVVEVFGGREEFQVFHVMTNGEGEKIFCHVPKNE